MRLLLVLIGISWVICGVLLFILTNKARNFIRKQLKEKNIRLLAIIPLVVGILLMRGAYLASTPWIAYLLGILALLKGLFFIFGPEKRTKPLIEWWLNASDNVYKSWSIAAFLLGVILLVML